MSRLARVVVPGYPHHITQRGNRRQQTFFCDEDYQAYIALMSEWCSKMCVAIWFYCLMPNHVHLIAVPESEDGLRRAIGEAHRRYTRRINFREGWRGHLWQGRFSSFVMDNKYLMTAVRYVSMNPVKSGLVKRPEQYHWSSTAAYLYGKKDPLVNVSGLNERVDNWAQFFSQPVDSMVAEKMRKHEQTGRPLGSENFVMKLEKILDRMLMPKKAGRKPKIRTHLIGSEREK
jgi:putative transposase